MLNRAQLREIRGGILISGTEIVPRDRGMKNIRSDNYLPRSRNSAFADVDIDTPAAARREARLGQARQGKARQGKAA